MFFANSKSLAPRTQPAVFCLLETYISLYYTAHIHAVFGKQHTLSLSRCCAHLVQPLPRMTIRALQSRVFRTMGPATIQTNTNTYARINTTLVNYEVSIFRMLCLSFVYRQYMYYRKVISDDSKYVYFTFWIALEEDEFWIYIHFIFCFVHAPNHFKHSYSCPGGITPFYCIENVSHSKYSKYFEDN